MNIQFSIAYVLLILRKAKSGNSDLYTTFLRNNKSENNILHRFLQQSYIRLLLPRYKKLMFHVPCSTIFAIILIHWKILNGFHCVLTSEKCVLNDFHWCFGAILVARSVTLKFLGSWKSKIIQTVRAPSDPTCITLQPWKVLLIFVLPDSTLIYVQTWVDIYFCLTKGNGENDNGEG